jgi:hypothetical protein
MYSARWKLLRIACTLHSRILAQCVQCVWKVRQVRRERLLRLPQTLPGCRLRFRQTISGLNRSPLRSDAPRYARARGIAFRRAGIAARSCGFVGELPRCRKRIQKRAANLRLNIAAGRHRSIALFADCCGVTRTSTCGFLCAIL